MDEQELTSLLKRVMEYQHDELLRQMTECGAFEKGEAEHMFKDMKRFLFICGTGKGSYFPPHNIKLVWEHFRTTFTKDYQDFCQMFFGKLVHYHPELEQDVTKGDHSSIYATLSGAENLPYLLTPSQGEVGERHNILYRELNDIFDYNCGSNWGYPGLNVNWQLSGFALSPW